jgi:hypothetical protein
MPTYRIYIVGRDDSFLGAAEVVECVDDNEAIGTASQIASGLGAEIWDQKRFVAQLPASDSFYFAPVAQLVDGLRVGFESHEARAIRRTSSMTDAA